MKIQPLTLPPEKARKELKQLAILGLILAVVGLFIMWIIGAIGLVLGGRALALSFNKGIKNDKDVAGFRIMAFGAIVIGLFDLLGGLALMN